MAKARMPMKMKKPAPRMVKDKDADGYKKGGMVKSKGGKGAC